MKQPIDPQASVARLVVERPGLIGLFERLGIDYCCGGHLSLLEACEKKGLDAKSVAQTIDAFASIQAQDPEDAVDWSAASLADLCTHIEETHHRYLTRELPQLSVMVEKVAEVHGQTHPDLRQVREVFGEMKVELLSHLQKEEKILFPLIRMLESEGKKRPGITVSAPIHQMEREHSSSGDALATSRELTEDYTPPADACGTYRAMLMGLERLERDLHRHIHKENNILFPRAIALEEAV